MAGARAVSRLLLNTSMKWPEPASSRSWQLLSGVVQGAAMATPASRKIERRIPLV